jgi:hypothetical protein
MHPAAEKLVQSGLKALERGLKSMVDSLLEDGQNIAEDAVGRVKRGRSRLRGEATVEGKKKKRRKGDEEE